MIQGVTEWYPIASNSYVDLEYSLFYANETIQWSFEEQKFVNSIGGEMTPIYSNVIDVPSSTYDYQALRVNLNDFFSEILHF